MPVNPTYPGVYIQELPSGVRTITGVTTSVTAFVGLAQTGPINVATHILSLADYERNFGGLVSYSDMSYAVSQFFLNGGSDAWVIRVVSNSTTSDKATFGDGGTPPKPLLEVDALLPGETDRNTDVFIEVNNSNNNNFFNLIIVSTSKTNAADSITEIFSNLSMSKSSPPAGTVYVETAVNIGTSKSQLVTVKDLTNGQATTLPQATPPGRGSLVSGAIATNATDGTSVVTTFPKPGEKSFRIRLDGGVPYTITPTPTSGATFADLNDVANGIQAAVQQLQPSDTTFTAFTCTVGPNTNQLTLTSGSYGINSSVTVLSAIGDNLAQDLALVGSSAPVTLSNNRLTGAQGGPFDPTEIFNRFIDDRAQHLGIYALEDVDIFNIMCLAGITDAGVLADAAAYCQERRAFLIIDSPLGQTPQDTLTPQDMFKYIESKNPPINLPTGKNGINAAVYYPRVTIADPLNNGTATTKPACGMIAGVYAVTDSSRGVWKAPAGTDASLVGAIGLERLLTDAENGILNPVHVNCLRVFPGYGGVVWGARTLAAPNDSDNRYIPVRRLTLYIEESLYRGLKWVVFEPNDEPLWAQIRLNVGAFMQNLFRQGAFQGQSPSDAYFVKCDKETTTQNDINLGIVNVIVGFAPLKPAEFVIVTIQQMAGQIQV